MSNNQFPEGCPCRSLAVHGEALNDFGEGWAGWINYLASFGEVQSIINTEKECYIEKALITAKANERIHRSVRHPFNGDCGRCGAALNVKLYPPDNI